MNPMGFIIAGSAAAFGTLSAILVINSSLESLIIVLASIASLVLGLILSRMESRGRFLAACLRLAGPVFVSCAIGLVAGLLVR